MIGHATFLSCVRIHSWTDLLLQRLAVWIENSAQRESHVVHSAAECQPSYANSEEQILWQAGSFTHLKIAEPTIISADKTIDDASQKSRNPGQTFN